jgi:hypothetical protein
MSGVSGDDWSDQENEIIPDNVTDNQRTQRQAQSILPTPESSCHRCRYNHGEISTEDVGTSINGYPHQGAWQSAEMFHQAVLQESAPEKLL